MKNIILTIMLSIALCSAAYAGGRVTLEDSDGAELGTADNPVKITIGGGTGLTEDMFAFTDVTTADSSVDQHGLLPKLDGEADHFLNGEGDWVAAAGGGNVSSVYTTATDGQVVVADGTSGTDIKFGSIPALLDGVFTSNGYLKRTGVATYTYESGTFLTANEEITLSGDASGSGTTSIDVTVADDSHAHTTTTISGIDISADTNLSATAPVTLTGDAVGITLSKDITTAGTGMSGGADDILPGADSDVTITLTVSKDIVAGIGLTGGENDVLPGADADVTVSLDMGVCFTKDMNGELLSDLSACKLLLRFVSPSDNGTETDYSSLGNSFTYVDASDWAAGDKIAKGYVYALDFDGSDDYLTRADDSDFSFGNSVTDVPFSVGGWIEVVDTAGYQCIIGRWISNGVQEWALLLDNTEKILLAIGDNSVTKYSTRTSDAALSVGWHFVVTTYDGAGGATAANTIKVYVDGVLVASTAANDADYVAMENTAIATTVGRESDGNANIFTGDMHSIFVTAEELSAGSIWKMYQKERGKLGV